MGEKPAQALALPALPASAGPRPRRDPLFNPRPHPSAQASQRLSLRPPHPPRPSPRHLKGAKRSFFFLVNGEAPYTQPLQGHFNASPAPAHASCTRSGTLVTGAHNCRGSPRRPAGIEIQYPRAGCSPLSSCRATPAPSPFSPQSASRSRRHSLPWCSLLPSAFHQPPGERDAPGQCFPVRCP